MTSKLFLGSFIKRSSQSMREGDFYTQISSHVAIAASGSTTMPVGQIRIRPEEASLRAVVAAGDCCLVSSLANCKLQPDSQLARAMCWPKGLTYGNEGKEREEGKE